MEKLGNKGRKVCRNRRKPCVVWKDSERESMEAKLPWHVGNGEQVHETGVDGTCSHLTGKGRAKNER